MKTVTCTDAELEVVDQPNPEQPTLAVRRLVAVLAAAFSASPNPAPNPDGDTTQPRNDLRRSTR
jgi:hypothetical protein